ncbi:LysE/ArgO family amino acid transporter [Paenibacillus elgii]|uniref:LysE/ArgO family amino acid transporter n=1 Tax=Paenibacillus elgii TaxID=189691 RepID=UPI0013D2EDFC|nr:LysE family transporter [Paenibacillus elgii]
MQAVLHGFVLALGLILPLGVQNLFIFQQGVVQRRFVLALSASVTAALCDTILILAAVLGVSVVILAFAWVKTVLLIAGAAFLLYLGWNAWKAASASGPSVHSSPESFRISKQIAFTASISLLNPHAILDTVGVIGTSSLNYTGVDKVGFTTAAIVVSWLWFIGMASVGRMTGKLDTSGQFHAWLNRISALMIWGTACYLIYSLFI